MENKKDPSKEALREHLGNLQARIRVQKIVATRSIRTPSGDIFCGLSATLSFQNDGLGAGVDLMPDSVEDREVGEQGILMSDVAPVYLFLQHKAYGLCLDSAAAAGAISEDLMLEKKAASKREFSTAIAKALRIPEKVDDDATPRG